MSRPSSATSETSTYGSTSSYSSDSSDVSDNYESSDTSTDKSFGRRANILLLGETGVGKSTFVNGFINYLWFDKMPESSEDIKKTIWAVPMSFSLIDNNYKQVSVSVGPSDKNEDVESVGASVTQDPKVHVFEAQETEIHLIDTPGIGDTRGYDYDKANFNKIIEFVKDYELHGICMLLKPNNARLNVFFKFCVEELLVHLPAGAVKNIIFCFTNARSTFYKPGDTYVPLKKLLEDRSIRIALVERTMYCFDNEAVRFLAARANGVAFSPEDTNSFCESWKRASDELKRAISHLKIIKPQSGKAIRQLEDVRKTITGLSIPMADITRIIQENIDLQKGHEKELKGLSGEEDDLKDRLKMEVIRYDVIEFDQPRTICMTCAKQVTVNGVTCIEFEKACHDPCYLKTVTAMQMGHPELRGCWAMGGGDTCHVCGHSYMEHMHTMHKASPKKVTEDDPQVLERLRSTSDRQAVIQEEIRKAKDKAKRYKKEYRRIIEISARFAQFIKKNAILDFNSSLGDYLKTQIKKLEDASDLSDTDKKRLSGFRESLQRYEEEVKIFQEAISRGKVTVPTDKEIGELIEELKNLPLTGESFKISLQANERMLKHYAEHLAKTKPATNSKKRRSK
ncbi:Hypothetical protein GLP15_385 [Giardia lamblia P15]|uniref:DUF8206 domain-containing protein n=1 Tax=Giardia intestinalis (strain P15) TaxID=658858 RepID=E1EXS3_GIAIA|nr:Hypothetical protein GLP15_385 [Giardia lamblia P15]